MSAVRKIHIEDTRKKSAPLPVAAPAELTKEEIIARGKQAVLRSMTKRAKVYKALA